MATRRKTLGALNTNVPNHGRLSLAPGAKAAPGTNADSNADGISTSKRYSMAAAAAARSSLAPRIGDPRPFKETAWRQATVNKVIAYLSTHFYQAPVSARQLQTMSFTDFKSVTMFLLRQIDPEIDFVQSSFPEELIAFMKVMRYPVNLSKSNLTNPGIPTALPAVLGLLGWLVDFLNFHQAETQKPTADRDAHLGDNDALFHAYVVDAYHGFMSGQEEMEAFDASLSKSFEERNRVITQEVNNFQQTNADLEREIELLQQAATEITELATKRVNLVSDVAKLQEFTTQLSLSLQKLQLKLNDTRDEQRKEEQGVNALIYERDQLKRDLDAQEFTPAQVEAMRHQQRMLETSLRSLAEQQTRVQKEMFDTDVNIGETRAEIERNCQEYNSIGLQIELLPAGAKYSNGVEHTMQVNPHGPVDDIVNVDLTKVVKPALIELHKHIYERIHLLNRELQDLSDQCSSAHDMKIDREERVNGLQSRFTKLDEIYRGERESMNAELQKCVIAVEDVELDLHRLKTVQYQSQGQSLQSAESELNALNQEYQHLSTMQAAQREELNHEACEIMDGVANHRISVNHVLVELCNRAEYVLSEAKNAHESVTIPPLE